MPRGRPAGPADEYAAMWDEEQRLAARAQQRQRADVSAISGAYGGRPRAVSYEAMRVTVIQHLRSAQAALRAEIPGLLTDEQGQQMSELRTHIAAALQAGKQREAPPAPPEVRAAGGRRRAAS